MYFGILCTQESETTLDIAAPLTKLLKKNQKWLWSEEDQSLFEDLKGGMFKAPVLSCPDFDKTFFLQTEPVFQA